VIKLDYTLLEELGLGGLDKEAKDSLLSTMYERLELNVGTVIAADLTDSQLKEFEQLIDKDDQQAALGWLQANYPDYKKVVEQELNKLKAEISQASAKILEQADAQPAE
jgi:hypothetical protein